MRGTREQVLILTKSLQEATRWCTGSVTNAPKADHTSLWRLRITGLATIVVAPVVPTKKLASATRCRRCTLLWLQNMTLPGTVLDLSRFCQGRTKWHFGWMQAGVHGNKVLPTVQSQANLKSSEQQSCPSSSSKPDLTALTVPLRQWIPSMYMYLFHLGPLQYCHVEIGTSLHGCQ